MIFIIFYICLIYQNFQCDLTCYSKADIIKRNKNINNSYLFHDFINIKIVNEINTQIIYYLAIDLNKNGTKNTNIIVNDKFQIISILATTNTLIKLDDNLGIWDVKQQVLIKIFFLMIVEIKISENFVEF